MKKILLVFIVGTAGLGLLMLAGLSFIGITPAYIASAPAVATGIGAKLLCSSRYVSGFSKAQSFDDLVQYSGILDQLTITYDDEETRVSASFFGLGEKSSTFIPGVGCSVDYAGFDIRPELAALVLTPEINASESALSSAWPRNDQVTTIDPQIQALIDAIVSEDNAAGLNTRALLVVKGGKVLGEAYAQGADASTPLLGWSMAKSLTSVMLASLEYRGLLDLAAPTSLGEWASDERAQIRVTDLLTMTDGLAFPKNTIQATMLQQCFSIHRRPQIMCSRNPLHISRVLDSTTARVQRMFWRACMRIRWVVLRRRAPIMSGILPRCSAFNTRYSKPMRRVVSSEAPTSMRLRATGRDSGR